jgi:hypothetical protein
MYKMDHQVSKPSRTTPLKRRADHGYSFQHHIVPVVNLSFKDNQLVIPGYKFNLVRSGYPKGDGGLGC